MPLQKIPLEDLRSLARRNRDFAWPTRARDNRLEPVCRPRFDAGFQFSAGDNVFTIGSCFASNIRNALRDAGFNVRPTDIISQVPARYRVNNLEFRYSPPSILQTFKWALEPDSLPGREDCYIETGDGQVFDPTIDHKTDGPVEEVREISRLVTDGDISVADCRVVVMTLGIAEAVYDTETGLYLECWPGEYVTGENRGRYEIHVLSAEESRQSLEETHALLSRHLAADFRIVLTVSPVPLTMTFRDCDVIAANTYSKSSLRAAAEAFALAHDNVDYLPVYESVMLSDRVSTWDVDLRHPTQFIVQVNTMRLLAAYFPDAGIDAAQIDELIAAEREAFEENWPQQMRAYKGVQDDLDRRLQELMDKSEAVRQAMAAEIEDLKAANERLQASNTQYLAQLVEADQ